MLYSSTSSRSFAYTSSSTHCLGHGFTRTFRHWLKNFTVKTCKHAQDGMNDELTLAGRVEMDLNTNDLNERAKYADANSDTPHVKSILEKRHTVSEAPPSGFSTLANNEAVSVQPTVASARKVARKKRRRMSSNVSSIRPTQSISKALLTEPVNGSMENVLSVDPHPEIAIVPTTDVEKLLVRIATYVKDHVQRDLPLTPRELMFFAYSHLDNSVDLEDNLGREIEVLRAIRDSFLGEQNVLAQLNTRDSDHFKMIDKSEPPRADVIADMLWILDRKLKSSSEFKVVSWDDLKNAS